MMLLNLILDQICSLVHQCMIIRPPSWHLIKGRQCLVHMMGCIMLNSTLSPAKQLAQCLAFTQLEALFVQQGWAIAQSQSQGYTSYYKI